MLEDLRSQGNDLHEVLIAKLARHRAEDAGAARVVLRAEDDGRVLVEPNGGAILPAEFARGPDDDRLDHLALLHLAAGRRNRHGGRDDVADRGVLAVMAAHHPDQQALTRTRVVRHLQPRLLLDHGDQRRTSGARRWFAGRAAEAEETTSTEASVPSYVSEERRSRQ